MAGIDLATATEQLNKYLVAEAKVLAGQVVDLDGQRLTRADLKAIQDGIDIWNGRVQRLSRSGRTVRRVVAIS